MYIISDIISQLSTDFAVKNQLLDFWQYCMSKYLLELHFDFLILNFMSSTFSILIYRMF